jgi:hypothetical protein
MPRGDRTGPWGQGPMTGRGVGYCAGYDAPGYANPASGWGYGRAWGRGRFAGPGYGRGGGGRGWRHQFYATGVPGWARYGYGPSWGVPTPPTRDQEMESLRREAEWLKQELDAINQRVADLSEQE